MSTVRKPKGHAKSARLKRDPFFYGWRDIYRKDRNGREIYLQIPLTEEDVLHPREGDHIVDSNLHWEDVRYLYEVFKTQLAAVTSALVLADVGVYWGVRSPHHHSPDVTVIFGVRPGAHWPSFHVKKEGVRPEMIIEVTSPSTRNVDLRKKRTQYFQVGVPYYFIADEQYRQGERILRLIGYCRGQKWQSLCH